MTIDGVRLSRTISHALRHDPARYGLVLDPHGWTDLAAVLAGVARARPQLTRATVDDVLLILAESDKQRFELDGDRIRARYGHSIDVPVDYTVTDDVPATLYHGTPSSSAPAILIGGLLPMRRQRVHLSRTPELARTVGGRRGRPVVLIIDTERARAAGVVFSRVDADVYLADRIPAEAIRRA